MCSIIHINILLLLNIINVYVYVNVEILCVVLYVCMCVMCILCTYLYIIQLLLKRGGREGGGGDIALANLDWPSIQVACGCCVLLIDV